MLSFYICLFFSLSATCSWAQNVPGEGKPLVVLAAPARSNNYYKPWFKEIEDFMISYANLVNGKDNVIIIASGEAYAYIKARVASGQVLKGQVEDIWMRDVGASIQKDPVLYLLQPTYLSKHLAKQIRKSFTDVMADNDVDPFTDFVQTDLIMDGGNVVDNGENTIVMTTRVLDDNYWYTKREIIQMIKDETYYDYVVIIDELEGDTTGHADGMVSFIDTYVLAMSSLGTKEDDDYFVEQLESQLEGSGVTVVVLPNAYKAEIWRTFTSACGLHINALTTTDYVYVPTFGHDPANVADSYNSTYDNNVIAKIEENTAKTVVAVPVPKNVCRMGGSVRCLSWQVEGEIADNLVNAATRKSRNGNGSG